jgi:glycerophosphoryl diester phosphodiesterase
LPAFAAAIEVGLSFELDVYQTSDEGLVVIHDEIVDRTTDGTGDITQMALADVCQLDAGRWFHLSFAGLKVPTLEEVFQLTVQRQRTPVTIAINIKIISPRIEKNIAVVVEKYNLFGQVFAFGQPTDSSRRFKEANMKMLTGARVPGWSYDKEQFDKLLSDPLADCMWTVDFVPSATEIERAHGLGKQVFLALNKDLPENIGDDLPDNDTQWDEAQVNKVDGICTDYPLECLWHWRMAGSRG